jgi:dTDP-4-dehydrorhamnose 3,5-epimerase
MVLPDGARLIPLTMHRDSRGSLTEIFRNEWPVGAAPIQWNVTKSDANVLRGVHVHHRHTDYFVAVSGRISVGLFDARRSSPTYAQSSLFELSGDDLSALRIPTGVLHGFYSHDASLFIYGVDRYFDPSDELACHWADPQLKIPWPCRDPLLNERDRAAGSLADVEAKLASLCPEFTRPGTP